MYKDISSRPSVQAGSDEQQLIADQQQQAAEQGTTAAAQALVDPNMPFICFYGPLVDNRI